MLLAKNAEDPELNWDLRLSEHDKMIYEIAFNSMMNYQNREWVSLIQTYDLAGLHGLTRS